MDNLALKIALALVPDVAEEVADWLNGGEMTPRLRSILPSERITQLEAERQRRILADKQNQDALDALGLP